MDEYLNLIPNSNRDKPKFLQVLKTSLAVKDHIKSLAFEFVSAFDIDTAVGEQLDTLGIWIGRSRIISTPIEGKFFEFRGDLTETWRTGVWRGRYQTGSQLITLPDSTYRTLLKAKIAANIWDGTIPRLYDLFDRIFPNAAIKIKDWQDMSVTVYINSVALSGLDIAVITGGYLPIRPAGVRIREYIVTNTTKIFKFDASDTLHGGFDGAGWAII
jgi:hypothetical protein